MKPAQAKDGSQASRTTKAISIAVVCTCVVVVTVIIVFKSHAPSDHMVTVKSVQSSLAPGCEHDLGFLAPGDTRNEILAVTNFSLAPVHVVNVRTGCQCLKATPQKEILQPGEPFEVRVVFAAPEKPTRYAKPLYIETSDPKNRLLSILIKADVGLPLVPEAQSLNIGSVIVGETKMANIRINNRGKIPARLLYSVSSSPDCVLKAPPTPIPAQGKLDIPVQVNPKSPGERTVTFNVATDIPAQENFPVTVKFTATSAAAAKP